MAELMSRWPAAISVLLMHRMGCVGCSMSSFETLREAAVNHQLDAERLMKEIREAIKKPAL
jgi:hybrid cluster-associated redox disulfide protein